MLAKMYGQLPSYIIANATTFDLIVAGALAEYESDLMKPPEERSTPKLSQDEMMNMIKSVREKK